MFETCPVPYQHYKYLKIKKETLIEIQLQLKDLGLMYLEGHPVVPIEVTEDQIKTITSRL